MWGGLWVKARERTRREDNILSLREDVDHRLGCEVKHTLSILASKVNCVLQSSEES